MRGKPGLTNAGRTRYYNALWQVAGMFDQIAPRGSEITEVRAPDHSTLTRSYPLINLGTMGAHMTIFIKPRERQVFNVATGEMRFQELELEFTKFPLDDAEREAANFAGYAIGTVAVHHGCEVLPTTAQYQDVCRMRNALQLVTGALALRDMHYFDIS